MKAMYALELVKSSQEKKLLDLVKNSISKSTILFESFVWETEDAAVDYAITKYGVDFTDHLRVIPITIRESLDKDIQARTSNTK